MKMSFVFDCIKYLNKYIVGKGAFMNKICVASYTYTDSEGNLWAVSIYHLEDGIVEEERTLLMGLRKFD